MVPAISHANRTAQPRTGQIVELSSEPSPDRRGLLYIFTKKFLFALFDIEHHVDVVF
jgi:hypothetical protein